MGVVIKKIGTTSSGCAGGTCDYTSLQAWEDALPANLVTDGNSQQGECYKDNEFTGSTALLLISGETTDATHTIKLTTASGQSFRDNASAQTNALDYNASNGVGITTSGGTYMIQTLVSNVTFSKLQLKATGDYVRCFNSETCSNILVDGCIISAAAGAPGSAGVVNMSGSQTLSNSLLIQKRSGALYILGGSVGVGTGCPNVYNCTIVATSNLASKPTRAIWSFYLSATVENTAIFGAASLTTGSTTFTFTTCMTDLGSPPTGMTGSKTYANQFVTTTAASSDFKTKTGADLLDAGTTDSTNAATDIVGTSRPQGSAYDIGCWELVSAAPPPTTSYAAFLLKMV